jgi:cholest-4-en-3-one 26-monooxygenase
LIVQLQDVDLTNPDNFVDSVPHEMLTVLRREAPVYWHREAEGPGFWNVTRHADVVAVNKDNLTFSSHRGATFMWEPEPALLEQQRLMMLNMDPPMHTRYRLLVNRGFTPRMVSQLEERARRFTRDILDRVCEKGECDFVTDVSAELPLQVIAELLGVPQEERHLVFNWSNRMIGQDDAEYQVGQEPELAAMELYAYFSGLAQQRRIDAKQDLVTALINAEVNGEKLSELELDLFFLLLSVAGNETTRNLISHGTLALMEHPDQRAKLLADPDLIPSAVEEMLRWASPVMHFRRTATQDTEIGGQPVKEGDKVVIWYVSANRDEDVFDQPFRFDVARAPNDHVAFGGGGPHFCLGANLARLEIRVMFEELLRRIPDFEPGGPPDRLRSNFINGIKHLPIRFTPSRPLGRG